jgi:glutathione S-transferase
MSIAAAEVFENMFKKLKGLGEPYPVTIKTGEANYHRFANVLDSELKAKQYLPGTQLTLADLSVSVLLT